MGCVQFVVRKSVSLMCAVCSKHVILTTWYDWRSYNDLAAIKLLTDQLAKYIGASICCANINLISLHL